MASDVENHFTVFIRLPFNRGSFVDPPPVAWSAAKERDLWEIISRQSKGNEIDWKKLAYQFEVTQPFLLQQAAWLYERQLSQVRAQMRRMGSRQSATASPAPNSASASVITAQAARRGGSISSRAPSRLSMQNLGSTTAVNDATTPSTPIRSRSSLPARAAPTVAAPATQQRASAQPKALSRKPSKDNDFNSRINSQRGSIQHQMTRSPIEAEFPERSSSEDEVATSKLAPHRASSSNLHRRTSSLRKSQHIRQQSIEHVDEETEEDESPAFLPFATAPETIRDSSTKTQHQDPSATIRGGFHHQQQNLSGRPSLNRQSTSERIRSTTTTAAMKSALREQLPPNLNSSASSNDGGPQLPPPRPTTTQIQNARRAHAAQHANATNRVVSPGLPTPLSPIQQAALAHAAGLLPRSPRRRPNHTHTGSESSPSMGSSFSDLDDASVTQSALEEALMSDMGSVATTPGVGGGGGGGNGGGGAMGALGGVGALGSRMSGISQALRSRYFDARSGTGAGNNGNGNNT